MYTWLPGCLAGCCLAGWLLAGCWLAGWPRQKKVQTFLGDFISTFPGNLAIEWPSTRLHSISKFPGNSGMKCVWTRKSTWIPHRKNKFEDQGSFYSGVPRELRNRIIMFWEWFYSLHIMYLVLTYNILSPNNRCSKNMAPVWRSDSYRFGSGKRDRPPIPPSL